MNAFIHAPFIKYVLSIRVLFKRFYCPICGEKLKVIKEVKKLTEKQKKTYYKELYPFGIPINIDIGKVRQMFSCPKCNYYNTTDNQLLIHKKQKRLKRKIISEND